MDNRTVSASPAKRFFVDMLTRDIELVDAILDLIDNCIDGILRDQRRKGEDHSNYEGYSAHIIANSDLFKIEDNCGGFSKDIAVESAFRLGRNKEIDADLSTVGVYGIGMKRSIFKLGRRAEIKSKCESDEFVVRITPEWLLDDQDWSLPIADERSDKQPGTIITISDIRAEVSPHFKSDAHFLNELSAQIGKHYSIILSKGFKITLNNNSIQPFTMKMFGNLAEIKSKKAIQPYCFFNTIDNVDVSVIIGLYRDVPDDDTEELAIHGAYSTESAGISVVCNERTVLYNDKTKITGWGVSNVPSYHTQFIGISGIVVFKSNNPLKLPLTTTKRGIDGNSQLYLEVKNQIMEGIQTFTSYTNKLKKASTTIKVISSSSRSDFDPFTLKRADLGDALKAHPRDPSRGAKFKPELPLPDVVSYESVIRFKKKNVDIQKIATHYLEDENASPSSVGEYCFDLALSGIGEK